MMRIRTVWAANLVALLMGIGMYSTLAFQPQFLQTSPSVGYGFGVSITQSGLILLPKPIGLFIVGFVSGRLARRFGSRNLLFVGAGTSACGYLLVASLH